MSEQWEKDEALAELRADLGFRPETKADEIIFPSGTVYALSDSGIYEIVRSGGWQ
jgi:hypothetical protein